MSVNWLSLNETTKGWASKSHLKVKVDIKVKKSYQISQEEKNAEMQRVTG